MYFHLQVLAIQSRYYDQAQSQNLLHVLLQNLLRLLTIGRFIRKSAVFT